MVNKVQTALAEVAERHSTLGDACVSEALEIITQDGLDKLSLREVARRLGVSHQAPYRHFESRDHLIAEVLRRCFRSLSEAISAIERAQDPIEQFRRMGAAYLRFAMERPLEYDLMFSHRWPEVTVSKEMIEDSCYGFEQLRELLTWLRTSQRRSADKERIDRDAMFVWSSLHGIALILRTDAMENLSIAESVRGGVPLHVMRMIEAALEAPDAT
jgi:AcrR family transcriptional regulator